MTVELVTGSRGGNAHVDSEDFGDFNAYTWGTGAYILNGCEITVTSANNVHIAAGNMLLNGRHVRVTGTGEDIAIDNGSSSYDRNDIIAYHYTKDTSQIEDGSFVAIKGTAVDSGEDAQDPAMPSAGKILEFASDAYVPIARIPIRGLTPNTPELIAEQTNPIAGIVDKVIAEGTSGDWYYRKWESGIAECWIFQSTRTTVNNANDERGNLFISGSINLPQYPFKMVSGNNTHFQYSLNSGRVDDSHVTTAVVIVSQRASMTNTQPPSYWIGRFQSLNEVREYNLSAYFKGRWK